MQAVGIRLVCDVMDEAGAPVRVKIRGGGTRCPLAGELALNVVVKSAGTDPDATVAPAVAAHLQKQGYAVPITKPVRATAENVATADLVISIGCDLAGYPAPRGKTVNWNDVPSPSENFAAADAAIKQKAIALVDELVRQRAAVR